MHCRQPIRIEIVSVGAFELSCRGDVEESDGLSSAAAQFQWESIGEARLFRPLRRSLACNPASWRGTAR